MARETDTLNATYCSSLGSYAALAAERSGITSSQTSTVNRTATLAALRRASVTPPPPPPPERVICTPFFVITIIFVVSLRSFVSLGHQLRHDAEGTATLLCIALRDYTLERQYAQALKVGAPMLCCLAVVNDTCCKSKQKNSYYNTLHWQQKHCRLVH
jgi:hypothetical protein